MKKGQIIRPAENYICALCGDSFPVKPYQLRERLKRSPEGKLFCSRECASAFRPRPTRRYDAMNDWSYLSVIVESKERRKREPS